MLETASLWVGSGTAPRFDDFVLSTLSSMFPHLVADFIAVCISIWKIFSGLKPGLWFLGGWLPFSLTHVVFFFPCFPWYKCAVLVSWSFGPFYPELCGSSPA
ncbi:hypothetical protein DY000_02052400 [Brassica cretica]|uniref:DUF4220 domain-containing protein n=1 Tax=Brassica cretica TaxID=69181 RepID=A0ABQ7AEP9_BRACR|nr:hypothetical protein DY000_02052400 [Brassica cretica]